MRRPPGRQPHAFFSSVVCPQCGLTQMVPALLGQFLLLELLGAGGMGAVYKALDQALGRYVAIKVMKQAMGDDPQFVENFLREARAAAAINHRNVVQIYSCGQEKGQPYIVMELVSGGRLDEMVGKGEPAGRGARAGDRDRRGRGPEGGQRHRPDPRRHQARQHPVRQGAHGQGGRFRIGAFHRLAAEPRRGLGHAVLHRAGEGARPERRSSLGHLQPGRDALSRPRRQAPVRRADGHRRRAGPPQESRRQHPGGSAVPPAGNGRCHRPHARGGSVHALSHVCLAC